MGPRILFFLIPSWCMPQHWALLVSHISYSLTQHSTILNSSFWDEWALMLLQSFFKFSPASWELHLSLNPGLWVPQRHNRLQNWAAPGRQAAKQPETQVSMNHRSAARAQGYPRTSAKSNPLCDAFSLCHIKKSQNPNAVLWKNPNLTSFTQWHFSRTNI